MFPEISQCNNWLMVVAPPGNLQGAWLYYKKTSAEVIVHGYDLSAV